ncbi:hypothetical protein [Muricoccus aerilatus]|uniref:hypothetical protein n=1 Tax=Muricoccus aerilatus TaxID=452982 RepID=UPI0005C161B8|nr:hypothetical protein [Roseomonas aerilata]
MPALTLDTGETLTENVAILDWVARQNSALKPSGAMGHAHLLELLAFISTEIHKAFKPFFSGAGDEEKKKAGEVILKRMGYCFSGLRRTASTYPLGWSPSATG